MLNSHRIYVAMDADDVGSEIELALLKGDILTAQKVHDAIQIAIQNLRAAVMADGRMTLVFSGCDDILVALPESEYNSQLVEQLRKSFAEQTTHTMSAGVGTSVAAASINLRKAKLAGKDQVVSDLDA